MSSKKTSKAAKAAADDKQPVLSRFFFAAPAGAASTAAAAAAAAPTPAAAAPASKARAPKRKGAEVETATKEEPAETAAVSSPAAASSRAKRPRSAASAAASKLREVVELSDDDEEQPSREADEDEFKGEAASHAKSASKTRSPKKTTVAAAPAQRPSSSVAPAAAAAAPASPARSAPAFFAPVSPSSAASAAASSTLASPFRPSLLPPGQKLSLPSSLPPRDPRVHQSFVDGILAREMEEEEAKKEERRKEEQRVASEKASRFIKGSAAAQSSAAAAASSSSAASAAAAASAATPAAASSGGVTFHTPASFDLARWSGIPGTTESTKFTPLEQQVLALKRAHPDVLLLVEVGYKYRFFGRDAEVAAALLDIVAHPGSQHLLTASIPTFRVYIHIKRLVEAGLKVGVVRQTETATGKKMEKASRARGGAKAEKGSAAAPLSLFSRGISELYTKATSVPALGDEPQANLGGSAGSRFLMVLFEENISNLSSGAPDSGIGGARGAQKVRCNLMALDPSSGDVVWDEFETDYLRGEIETRLQQVDPIEILVSADPTKLSANTSQLLLAFAGAAASKDGGESSDAGVRLEKLDTRRFKFDYPTAAQTVRRFFEGLGGGGAPAATDAASSSSAASASAPANKRGKKAAKEVHVLSDDDEEFAGEAAPATAATASSAASASSSSLASLALALPKGALICLGILIPYLQSFAGGGLDRALRLTANFRRLGSVGREREYMELDGLTLHNLEVIGNQEGGSVGSLLWLLSHTKTAFGARMLRKWVLAPLASRAAINARLEAVSEVLEDGGWASQLITLLHQLPDLERGMARIQIGQCKPVEFLRILRAFERVNLAFPDSSTIASLRSEFLRDMFSAVDYPQMKATVAHFLGALNAAAVEAGQTADFFDDPALYPAVQRVKDSIREIEAGLQQELVDARRKLGPDYSGLQYLSVNSVEFLIELKNADLKRAPKEWVQISATKVKTRFHPPRVVELIDRLQLAREELKIVAGESWRHFLGQFISGGAAADALTEESKDAQDEIDATFSTPAVSAAASNPLAVGAQGGNYLIFRSVISCLAKLDCIVSLAAVAALPGYVCPQFDESDDGVTRVEIRGGRHPMIESMASMAGASVGSFVPNDITICSGGPTRAASSSSAELSSRGVEETRFYCVSGANMGGKSTYIRSMALLIILSQIGSYVPADSLRISGPPIDAVYTRMGARDLITKGQSTFHVELSETRSILSRATSRSFVILDELGRGTSTSDGTAIALATSEYIIEEIRCPTILVTHYPVLGGLANKYPPHVVRTWHMSYIEEDADEVAVPAAAAAVSDSDAPIKVPHITFLFKLVPGMSPSSFGLNVGRMAHLPGSVLALAAVKSAEMRRQNQIDEQRKENAKKQQAWKIMQDLLQGTSTDPPAVALQRLRQLMPANTADHSEDATTSTQMAL